MTWLTSQLSTSRLNAAAPLKAARVEQGQKWGGGGGEKLPKAPQSWYGWQAEATGVRAGERWHGVMCRHSYYKETLAHNAAQHRHQIDESIHRYIVSSSTAIIPITTCQRLSFFVISSCPNNQTQFHVGSNATHIQQSGASFRGHNKIGPLTRASPTRPGYAMCVS